MMDGIDAALLTNMFCSVDMFLCSGHTCIPFMPIAFFFLFLTILKKTKHVAIAIAAVFE